MARTITLNLWLGRVAGRHVDVACDQQRLNGLVTGLPWWAHLSGMLCYL